MITDYQKIRNAIEKHLSERTGISQFIIYPFGEYGMLTKKILNESFGIQEKYIADNRLSKFNLDIKNLNFFQDKDVSGYTVLLTNANPDVHEEVRIAVNNIFDEENIVDIFPLEEKKEKEQIITRCGKYSYGPLCNHWLVESIGAFSSTAEGTDVVQNHPMQYISTHAILYYDKDCNCFLPKKYDECKDEPWYFPEVRPHGIIPKFKRIKIGNDVWLGKNVIITNGADIGNGVVAAAGAVITKDIPDYAVVAGVPARIIKYRFTPEQINALNKIAWWNWSDEKIRKYYDDFYLNIETFIDRHKNDRD